MLSDASYKTILDCITDGVYVVGRDRKIAYWNRGAERLTGFAAAEVLGRQCRDNVLNHVDTCGSCLCRDNCPLQATLDDGQTREASVFLHHKDGHRRPVQVCTNPIRNAQGEIIAAVETFHDNADAARHVQTIEVLKKVALVDRLTGLANRGCTERRLESRLKDMRHYGWPVGVLMADIDRFKRINDSFGHEAGDKAICMVSNSLVSAVRAVDTVGRWGGEEFLIIMTNIGLPNLQATAERARMLVQESFVEIPNGLVKLTISVGVAAARPGDTAKSLVKRADAALYQSKEGGRNRVSVAKAA
jgi:diguanylate cyclase (GGDEF)-like protein/PAS domain S-box-containing protein